MKRFWLVLTFNLATVQTLFPRQALLDSSGVTSPLTQLLAFSESHRIAIGIVLGRPRKLCTQIVSLKSLPSDPDSYIQRILIDSGYVATKQDDSYVVHESEILEQEKVILNHSLVKFGSPPGPMSLIGESLQGFIQVEVEGEKGFFIHHMSDTAEQQIALKTMHNASVEEVANQLISMDGKGIWELSLTKNLSAQGAPKSLFRVFSYDANKDAIRSISCSQAWTE